MENIGLYIFVTLNGCSQLQKIKNKNKPDMRSWDGKVGMHGRELMMNLTKHIIGILETIKKKYAMSVIVNLFFQISRLIILPSLPSN